MRGRSDFLLPALVCFQQVNSVGPLVTLSVDTLRT